MHLPPALRRAAHRLVSLARTSKRRGCSDPLSAALTTLAADDADLIAVENQWWDEASTALKPALVQVVGAPRAQAVAAAMDEIAAELAAATGEVLGDDLAGELVRRGVLTEAEYAELDVHNTRLLHHNSLNPLSQIIHATWGQLAADGLVQGAMPAVIKLSAHER